MLFFCSADTNSDKVIKTHRIKYGIIILLFAVSLQGIGQNTEDVFFPKIGIGANAFGNYSSIDFRPGFNQTFLMGYGGGLVINYVTDESKGGIVHRYTGTVHTGVQFEFNIQQRGWKEDTDSTPDIYKQNVTYFEIPFLSHITWGKRNIKYVVDFGPYIGFIYSSKNETLYLGADSTYYQKYFGRDPDSKFEYGVLISPGLFWSSDIGVFSLQARYTQGMKKVFDEIQIYDNRILRRSYNKGIQVAIGYYFPITRKRTIVYHREREKKE